MTTYIIPMPPMPPMPPPMPPMAAAAAAASTFSGLSATSASVVSSSAATDAAFCSAERVTLAGSMTPALTRSSKFPVAALSPTEPDSLSTWRTDDRAFEAGVDGDPLERLVERLGHDAGTGGLVAVEGLGELLDRGPAADESDAAPGHDAFLDGGPGGRQGVLDAVLLLLELDLGGGADPHHGDAAGQLGQALLELLAVPVGVGVLDLTLDLGDAALHVVGLAGTVDDRWCRPW